MDFLKKRSAWLLALVLPLLLFARGAMAEEWTNLDDEIMKRGTVRIGIGYSTPPMNYLDDKGQPAGFDVDLAKALCEKMGLRYTITKVNNKTRITSLVSGETDMVLSNMNHTMSRARQIDFSDTYLLDGKRVLAAKGRYHALKDFVGRRVAVCQGSNAQQAVTEALKKLGDPSPRVMSFQNDSECFLALKTGKVDGWTNDTVILAGVSGGDRGFEDLQPHLLRHRRAPQPVRVALSRERGSAESHHGRHLPEDLRCLVWSRGPLSPAACFRQTPCLGRVGRDHERRRPAS